MSENHLQDPPPIEQSGTSPEQNGLQELGKNLSLPDEAIGRIDFHKKKGLIVEDLQDIQQEIWKAGYTRKNMPEDVKKKIQDTLLDYGIVLNNNSEQDNNITSKTEQKLAREGEESVKNPLDALKQKGAREGEESKKVLLQAVEKNVQSVKELNPKIVDSELETFKKSSPLPDNIAERIAEKTGSTKDEVLRGEGRNASQVKNLVDAYYLSSETLASNVISKLPESDQQKADTVFRNLRSSMNDAEIPSYPVQAPEVKRLIPDKSDKTQELVSTTVSSLTHPDTLITRTGDRLNWEGTDGKKYTINMERRPPKLSKQDGILRVEQDIHSTEEVEEQARTRSEYERTEQSNITLEGKIATGYSRGIELTISEHEETTHISSREIRELMDTLGKREETIETKQRVCERLITLYGIAETLPEFQPKMDTETMRIDSVLSENIRDTRKNLTDLQRGLRREKELQGKLPNRSDEQLTSTAEWEVNTTHNFKTLNELGLGGLQSMDEVVGFFQSQRGQVADGVWSDKASINRYLGSTRLEDSQIRGFFGKLVDIYDAITGKKVGKLQDEQQKWKELQRDTGDGKTALSVALKGYRAENGLGTLRHTDFERLLSQKTP